MQYKTLSVSFTGVMLFSMKHIGLFSKK